MDIKTSRNIAEKSSIENRVSSFDEVNKGFDDATAKAEAARCLMCKSPRCVTGCPVEVDIPGFIKRVRDNDAPGALRVIKERNSLPAICGRVCPQESQCEAQCILGKRAEPVAIGLLERWVADKGLDDPESATVQHVTKKGRKVAVIGSGPAGLTASADLALMGYNVTLFESLHSLGGVLRYGIPEFRLPKQIVDKEVGYIRSLGVEIEPNVIVGQTVTIDELKEEGYEAFFISTGAGLPYFLGIPGENLGGVYTANEFLTRVNLMKAYLFPEYDTPVRIGEIVAVVGGGNVAMDAARTARRLGAKEVYIIYRRTQLEMPARHEEVENAEEEGVIFKCLANPTRIVGDDAGHVKAIECIKMEPGPLDHSGRRTTVPVPGSMFIMPVDTVIVAVGQGPNPILTRNTPELELSKGGYVSVTDTNGATNMPGIFAGGDIVTGAATVIAAMGQGKAAAKAIDAYLAGK